MESTIVTELLAKTLIRRFIARVVNIGLDFNLDDDSLCNKIRHVFNFIHDVVLTYLVKRILNAPNLVGDALLMHKRGIIDLDSFPDDLIIEISSRLSIQDAMRFRCVCKRFSNLLGRPDFVNSHANHSAPMIFVNNGVISFQFLLDICWKSGKYAHVERCPCPFERSPSERSFFHLNLNYDPQLSHDGLIVSKDMFNNRKFIIFNPLYCGKVELVVPDGCQILGVFYHPLVKEYRTIWESTISSEPLRVAYKVLNLCSQPNWREVMNPLLTQNTRICAIAPVLLNVHLYWAVHYEPEGPKRDRRIDIIEFDTINERFEVIPCPDNVKLRHHLWDICNVSLQKVNGCLVLIHFSKKDRQRHLKIDIWMLENRMNKKWSKCSEYIFNGSNCPEVLNRVDIIALWDEKLVLRCSGEDFLCNLRLIKTETFQRNGFDGRDMRPHVMSLASLKDCNPKICVDG